MCTVPRSLLSKLPPWRQLVVIAVVLPLGVIAAVLAFAWPAGRIAPRDLPVGIVGAGAGSQQIVEQLGSTRAGQFDLRLYASQRAARAGLEDGEGYGAFVVDEDGVTVLEASAASPAVAQLLTA